jgi:flavin reductase (DIM6/NTAB) family NADH-FMN oxidoreductase RutF
MEQAHQCSAKYDANTSEFEQTGLEVFLSEKNIAPYVLSSAIKIGLELVEIIPIPLNQTSLVIGKIIEIILPESIISEDGFVAIASAGSITCNGLDSYYSVKALKRIPYAKP